MLDRARYRLSTVLTGLISHDRRLSQRIVELARDPLSYFGNLVSKLREERSVLDFEFDNHLIYLVSLDNNINLKSKKYKWNLV